MCKLSGVSHFKLDGLELQFGTFENILTPAQSSINYKKPDLTAQNKDSLLADELSLKEEQISMLLIEDPVEYERQIASGEIEIDESNIDEEDSTED